MQGSHLEIWSAQLAKSGLSMGKDGQTCTRIQEIPAQIVLETVGFGVRPVDPAFSESC